MIIIIIIITVIYATNVLVVQVTTRVMAQTWWVLGIWEDRGVEIGFRNNDKGQEKGIILVIIYNEPARWHKLVVTRERIVTSKKKIHIYKHTKKIYLYFIIFIYIEWTTVKGTVFRQQKFKSLKLFVRGCIYVNLCRKTKTVEVTNTLWKAIGINYHGIKFSIPLKPIFILF